MTFLIICLLSLLVFFLIKSLNKGKANILINESNTTLHESNSVFQNDFCSIQLAGSYYNQKGSKLEFGNNEQVFLVREHNNIHDAYAVKVINFKGTKIGFIPKSNSKEFSNLIDEGYYFKVFTSIIIDRPDRTLTYLNITRTKDPTDLNFSIEEIAKLDRKGVEELQNYEHEIHLSFETCQKALALEKEGKTDEAVAMFHSVILLPKPPPIAFDRLAIYYRKKKEYQNEIDVLNKKINDLSNSKIVEDIKHEITEKVKLRIQKSEELLKGTLNK